jgi:hypothetical protein
MTTFVLYNNPKHDFSNIKNPKFIFGQSDIKFPNTDLNAFRDKLEEVLDAADKDNDMLVVNGPSYLAAIAGMIWLTQSNRKFYNMLAYNPLTKTYENYQQEL